MARKKETKEELANEEAVEENYEKKEEEKEIEEEVEAETSEKKLEKDAEAESFDPTLEERKKKILERAKKLAEGEINPKSLKKLSRARRGQTCLFLLKNILTPEFISEQKL